ncbi:NAD(P)-dependent oxidoreductase [Rhodococcus sp. HNM0569]|uniref:NAD(P)-binding domain-containing protein n=1 Tax=Rhodococcus sp. HNM0569 TaxID=2716340 RepID=UPI00146C3F61|nr:NAD(P)-dependent oxidoreductase [Rhodococcus sp. HNM0569]
MSAPVGFVGLGQMGGSMARKLADWPGGLVVSDVRSDATEWFREHGATIAASPAEVAAAAGHVSIAVLDDKQVAEVVAGPEGVLSTAAPGTVVAIHSTIDAATAESLARAAEKVGVHVVDAPVSGGAMGARGGTLAVMVGGSDEAFEAVREPFSRFSDKVVHAGPVGSGTRMKLARNLLHFVSFTAATEAQRLAEAAGLDLEALGDVVRHSDAVTGGPGSIMLRPTAARIEDGDPWLPILSHVRDLGEKDLSLALAVADGYGVDLPLARRALAELGDGLGVGAGPLADPAPPSSRSNDD